jgi:hypothetical protein
VRGESGDWRFEIERVPGLQSEKVRGNAFLIYDFRFMRACITWEM